MQTSSIVTHKNGFNVDVYINWHKGIMELRKIGSNKFFSGKLSTYTNFKGNLADFVNKHTFN